MLNVLGVFNVLHMSAAECPAWVLWTSTTGTVYPVLGPELNSHLDRERDSRLLLRNALLEVCLPSVHQGLKSVANRGHLKIVIDDLQR